MLWGTAFGGLWSMFPWRRGRWCSHNVHNELYSRCMLWGTAIAPCFWRRWRCMQPHCTHWSLLQVYAVGDSLRSMFLNERALRAATLYTLISTSGVCRGRQPSVHVPEGEGTACSHIVHNDLYSRCTPWGTACGPCSWRRWCCMQTQCTQWSLLQVYDVGDRPSVHVPEGEGPFMQPKCSQCPLLQVYAVGDSLRSMFLKEWALHAATMYTMTCTLGLRCRGQPSLHIPTGEGAACSPNVHNDLYSRCMLWGEPSLHVPEGDGDACSPNVHYDNSSRYMLWGPASDPCSWRIGCCMQPLCTQWTLPQVYAVGDSLRSMFLKEAVLLQPQCTQWPLSRCTPWGTAFGPCSWRWGCSCSHNVHDDLYSRCTLWGTACGPCSWRRGHCCGRGHPPASPGLCHQGIPVFSSSTTAALARCWLGYPEKLDRGGPCWLWKLRWMGT